MNGSWQLGRLLGIDVRIHWTFLLLPAWVYVSSLSEGSGAVAATLAVFFVLAIFGCVLLHEMGHALMARRFGIPTRDITLLPIGGVASLQRMPRQPWQELAIAVAGPAVNVVIAVAILAGLLSIDIAALSIDQASDTVSSFATRLALVNIGLVVFNMLPAFPMDGGRVLRSLLAMNMPYTSATRIAAKVGQFSAVGFGLLGLFSGNLILVFIAGFIFLAARGEVMRASAEVGYDERSRDAVKERLTNQSGLSAPCADSLPIVNARWDASSALSWLRSDPLEEFLVSNDGSLIGLLDKNDLRKVVRDGWGAMAIERLLASGIIQTRAPRSA